MSEIYKNSLYNIAKLEINRLIEIYLELVQDTDNLENISRDSLKSRDAIIILLAGLSSNADSQKIDADQAIRQCN